MEGPVVNLRQPDALVSGMKRLLRDISGATAIEYCLIAGLIALVIVGSVTSLGTRTQGLYQSVADGFTTAR